jgi:ABC-2 type transport system permease protein
LRRRGSSRWRRCRVYKTLQVAIREFVATVFTKGFLLGVLLPPALMTLALMLIPLLMNQASPRVSGDVVMMDESGRVFERLAPEFTPEKLAERMGSRRKEAMKQADKMMPMTPEQKKVAEAMASVSGPDIRLERAPEGGDIEALKRDMIGTDAKASGEAESGPRRRLAVIRVPGGAVVADAAGAFASYEVYVAPKLDPEVQSDIRSLVGAAIVDARVSAAGLDPAQIRSLSASPANSTVVVTAEGERKSNDAAALLIPVGFMFLLWVSVFTGGQYLLTSTVEEKSSRVMEVLLSAVSPQQLMVGKILGQMAVASLVLVAYLAIGVGSLLALRQEQLIDPSVYLYLPVFFFIAFFLVAAMMAAIGSAVNDMREAQALLGPVMIVLVIPMMLWLPISRNPNSTFALVCSFLPPISPFVMVLRLAGSEKIPAWQAPVAVVLGLATCVVAGWAAGKVFRIGVLMYGKPPNFATLVRWMRAA